MYKHLKPTKSRLNISNIFICSLFLQFSVLLSLFFFLPSDVIHISSISYQALCCKKKEKNGTFTYLGTVLPPYSTYSSPTNLGSDGQALSLELDWFTPFRFHSRINTREIDQRRTAWGTALENRKKSRYLKKGSIRRDLSLIASSTDK